MKPGDRITYFRRVKGSTRQVKIAAEVVAIFRARARIKLDSGELKSVSLESIEKVRRPA